MFKELEKELISVVIAVKMQVRGPSCLGREGPAHRPLDPPLGQGPGSLRLPRDAGGPLPLLLDGENGPGALAKLDPQAQALEPTFTGRGVLGTRPGPPSAGPPGLAAHGSPGPRVS